MESIITQFKNDLNTLCKYSNVLLYFLNMLEASGKQHDTIDVLANNPEVNSLIQSVGYNMAKLVSIIGPISKEVEKKETWEKAKTKSTGTNYASFEVDESPIIDNIENKPNNTKFSFQDYITSYKEDTGKDLKPVKLRDGKHKIDYDGCCPECGAPREYLYDNVTSLRQLLCKCCKCTFTVRKTTYLNKIVFKCPHCKHTLQINHERGGYDVYVCQNDNCIYRVNKIKTLQNRGISLKEISSGKYKIRYSTRIFEINLDELAKQNLLSNEVKGKLSNINNSQIILGLILTYYITYGLSSRKTSAIMKDIHEVEVSHQSVLNYASYTAKVIEPYLENYKYDQSNIIVGDETYVKIMGKHAYVFFFSDSKKKIITSYHIFKNRDTLAAIKSMYQTIKKYQSNIPKDLQIITDGNPIYKAAQVFFNMENINFDLYQVIGIKNSDKISETYRPHKQVTERLNRTYKYFYSDSNGFSNELCANIYMILFTANFNFLRPHSGLDYKVPVEVDEIQDQSNMQSKWLKLIELGYKQAA